MPLTDEMMPHLTYSDGGLTTQIICGRPSKPSFNSLCVSLLTPPKPRKAVPSLGNIKLPNELLNMVLLALPFKGLIVFMATNSSARHAVLAMPAFYYIIRYGWQILRILLRIQPLEFSTPRIYGVLTSPSCVYCANFGGYVFLSGLLRCCQWCAEKDKRMIPITKITAQKKATNSEYKLNTHSIASLPIIETLSGSYQEHGHVWAAHYFDMYKRKANLISRTLAQDAMTAQFLKENPSADPSTIPQMGMPEGTYQDNLQRNMALALLPYFSRPVKSLQEGRRCLGCDEYKRNRHRCDNDPQCWMNYVSEISYYPKPTFQSDGNVYGAHSSRSICQAEKMQKREYLPEDFKLHYAECEHAKRYHKRLVEYHP